MTAGSTIDPRAVVHDEARIGEDVHIGPYCVIGADVTIGDLAVLIRDLASPSVVLEFDPTKPSGPRRRVADSHRIRSLGFVPSTRLVYGLTSTIDWYRTYRAQA